MKRYIIIKISPPDNMRQLKRQYRRIIDATHAAKRFMARAKSETLYLICDLQIRPGAVNMWLVTRRSVLPMSRYMVIK